MVFRYQSWYLTAQIKGTRVNRSMNTSQVNDAVEAAKVWLDQNLEDKSSGLTTARKDISWGTYSDAFMENAGAHVAQKHVRHYVWVLEKVLRDIIGENFRNASTDYPTAEQIEKWKARKVRERNGSEKDIATARRYVNSMIRQVRAYTSQTWQSRLGISLGEGAHNLRQAQKFNRVPVPVFRPSNELLDRTFEWARQLKDVNPDAHRVFWFAIGTGARRSEIANVKWEHIITDSNPVVVQGDFLTKDGSEAFLPFVYPEAWERFSEVPREQDGGYILGPPDTHRADRAFRYICHEMKLMGWTGRFKIHELRAAVITKVYEKHGLKLAQAVARHKNATTTDKYIRHRLPEIGTIEF